MRYDSRRIDIDIIRTSKIELDSHPGGEVEVRVQRASPVPRFDRLGRGELVDVVGAGGAARDARTDAVAFGADFGEGEVYFGDYAGDVEAAGIADAAVVLGPETRADASEAAIVVVVVGGGEGGGEGGNGEEGGDEDGREEHGVSVGVDL